MRTFLATILCLIGNAITLIALFFSDYFLIYKSGWYVVIGSLLLSYNIGGIFGYLSAIPLGAMDNISIKGNFDLIQKIHRRIVSCSRLIAVLIPWVITPDYSVLHIFACIAATLAGLSTYHCIIKASY